MLDLNHLKIISRPVNYSLNEILVQTFKSIVVLKNYSIHFSRPILKLNVIVNITNSMRNVFNFNELTIHVICWKLNSWLILCHKCINMRYYEAQLNEK